MKAKLIVVALFFAGCAVNSGVVPIGQDTFMVSRQAATGFSGSGDLKAEAIREANQGLQRGTLCCESDYVVGFSL